MTLKWNSLISLKDDSHIINQKHVVHLLLSINTRKINAIYTQFRTTEANNGYLSIYLPIIIKNTKIQLPFFLSFQELLASLYSDYRAYAEPSLIFVLKYADNTKYNTFKYHLDGASYTYNIALNNDFTVSVFYFVSYYFFLFSYLQECFKGCELFCFGRIVVFV